jgi:protein-S-isoprenylcysteine O-methyltransferase Ste14
MSSLDAAPAWASALSRLSTHLSTDFLGGPRPFRLNQVINAQKGSTCLFVGGLMWVYGNGSTEAWTYLALHGSYGLCWILKDLAFPDPRWKVRITLGGAFMSLALVMVPYWVAPWLLISGVLQPRPPATPGLMAAAIALHTFGLALMLGADAQRHFVLRDRKGLITDGMFRYVRRPNYLGEMMLYASYALLVRHWIPWLILAWVWCVLFLPNMLVTDASLSRHEGWAAYKARTGLLLPRPFTRPERAPRRSR